MGLKKSKENSTPKKMKEEKVTPKISSYELFRLGLTVFFPGRNYEAPYC